MRLLLFIVAIVLPCHADYYEYELEETLVSKEQEVQSITSKSGSGVFFHEDGLFFRKFSYTVQKSDHDGTSDHEFGYAYYNNFFAFFYFNENSELRKVTVTNPKELYYKSLYFHPYSLPLIDSNQGFFFDEKIGYPKFYKKPTSFKALCEVRDVIIEEAGETKLYLSNWKSNHVYSFDMDGRRPISYISSGDGVNAIYGRELHFKKHVLINGYYQPQELLYKYESQYSNLEIELKKITKILGVLKWETAEDFQIVNEITGSVIKTKEDFFTLNSILSIFK